MHSLSFYILCAVLVGCVLALAWMLVLVARNHRAPPPVQTWAERKRARFPIETEMKK